MCVAHGRVQIFPIDLVTQKTLTSESSYEVLVGNTPCFPKTGKQNLFTKITGAAESVSKKVSTNIADEKSWKIKDCIYPVRLFLEKFQYFRSKNYIRFKKISKLINSPDFGEMPPRAMIDYQALARSFEYEVTDGSYALDSIAKGQQIIEDFWTASSLNLLILSKLA